MSFAVIDLGTNGFRLYIAESNSKGQFNIIHRQASELKLASEGIFHIGDAPFKRGLETMKAFAKTLELFDIQHIKAFGTAALRLADNGALFIETVEKQTGILIELISGDREAELIYKGMKLGVPLSKTPVLMIDVGGGSVEFIICNEDGVFWAKSFNVGVAILKQQFHQNGTISEVQIQQIKEFLDMNCSELTNQVALLRPQYPVIACGTLDFLVKILRGVPDVPLHFDFSKQQFLTFYQQLTFLSEPELIGTPNVPTDKIEMLAVTLVLMEWIMTSVLGADRLVASGQSMKAGILYEMSFLD